MAGVDDVDGVSVAAHPGASASAAFTTIARCVSAWRRETLPLPDVVKVNKHLRL